MEHQFTRLQTTCPLSGLDSWRGIHPAPVLKLHLEATVSLELQLLLEPIASLNNAIWTIRYQVPQFPLRISGRIGDAMESIEKFTHNASFWGTHWLVLGFLSWHIWRERNRRLKQAFTCDRLGTPRRSCGPAPLGDLPTRSS